MKLIINFNKAHDVGKAVYSILFGVCFGLSVSIVLPFKRNLNAKENSGYISSIFALIGEDFLNS